MIFQKDINKGVILLVAIILLLSPVLFTAKTYYLRDITYLFHPWKSLSSELLQQGKLPLWNPYVFCGMPLLANWQSAILYPLSILFYVFAFPIALKIFYFLHFFIAGAFAFLFARQLRLSSWASTGLMLVATLNGYLLTKMEFLSHLGVDVWIFALFLLVRRPFLLGIGLALSFLGGHQIFVFQAGMLALYWIMEHVTDRQEGTVKNAAIVLAVFFGIIALQLLPTLELAAFSARLKAGISPSIATLHSLTPASLLGFFNPALAPAALDLTAGEIYQWDTTIYIGFAAALCALFAFKKRTHTRLRIFALGIMIIGIVFAFGSSTPFYSWLYKHSSFFKTFRYPAQFSYLAVVGLTLLAGIGLDTMRLKPLLTAFIFVELLYLGFNAFPTTGHKYFYVKNKTVSLLQHLGKNNRFILSPGTEKNRHMQGHNLSNAWQHARDYMYNLTCIPYHVRNAYGFGEPLTVQNMENYIQDTYRQPTPQSSLERYKVLGVRYLLCRDRLANTQGYTLLNEQAPWVYRIEGNTTLYEARPSDNCHITETFMEADKISLSVETKTATSFIWKELLFPGWYLYVNGVKNTMDLQDTLFRRWELAPGRHIIVQRYLPVSFLLGIIVTLLTLCSIILYGLKRILVLSL